MRTTPMKKSWMMMEFMRSVTIRQLFLGGVTDQWAQVLKPSALKTLEEELQAYDLLELDASDKSRSQKKKKNKKKQKNKKRKEKKRT
jgi:hypothetical protein